MCGVVWVQVEMEEGTAFQALSPQDLSQEKKEVGWGETSEGNR